MKKVFFVNGSPRGKNSASQCFISEVCRQLDKNRTEVTEVCLASDIKADVRKGDFEKLTTADSIVFVFPLYIDSIPSSLLDFLYCFEDYWINEKQGMRNGKKAPDVYAIINCGFIEGRQNINAMRIMQHFAASAGLNWRFGIGIGAGEFMRETQKNIPIHSKIKLKVYKAILRLKEDIEKSPMTVEKNIFTNPAIPKFLFMFAGDRHWIEVAGKSKVKRKALYARPLTGE